MLGLARQGWRGKNTGRNRSETRVKETGLGTVPKVLVMQGFRFGSLYLGIEYHEALGAIPRTLGIDKVTAIVDPARLKTMRDACRKCSTRARTEIVKAHLEPPTHCSREGELVGIERIPRGLRAMAAYVGGNSGQGPAGQVDPVELGFATGIGSHHEATTVGRPTRSRLVTLVFRDAPRPRVHLGRQPKFGIPSGGKDEGHLPRPWVLRRSQVVAPILGNGGDPIVAQIEKENVVKGMPVASEENAAPIGTPAGVAGNLLEISLGLGRGEKGVACVNFLGMRTVGEEDHPSREKPGDT